MFKVGLCGGIASGKTTISRIFESLGVRVIDTDALSHKLMQPGQSAYQKTVDRYGQQILQADSSLNRSLLREIVFNDQNQKQWLEEMLHPLIQDEAIELMQQLENECYIILVVPLMFESGFDKLLDHIVAIDCPREVQLARLTRRDGIDTTLANMILDAQMDNEQRLSLADSVIANPNNRYPTKEVADLHQKLTRLSSNFKS